MGLTLKFMVVFTVLEPTVEIDDLCPGKKVWSS